jgi:hypothetical protein
MGLVMTLMLSSIALAAGVTQPIGPYAVSFDVKTNMDYQIQPGNPIETPEVTIYPMQIITDNNTWSTIIISENKDPVDSTPVTEKVINRLDLMLKGFNSTEEDRVIDGKKGFVLIGEPVPGNQAAPPQLIEAFYWMDGKECECGPVSVGKTEVSILSSYPIDVTNSILNSLKITKSQ